MSSIFFWRRSRPPRILWRFGPGSENGGGIPTGITQNVKNLLSSREVENIFENSDFIYMLNQAAGDRQILAKHLNISSSVSYVDPLR